jgi:hypothetical protein
MLDKRLQQRIDGYLQNGLFSYSEDKTYIFLNAEKRVGWLEDDSFFYDIVSGANLTQQVDFVLNCDIFVAVEIARVLSTRVIPKLVSTLEKLGHKPSLGIVTNLPEENVLKAVPRKKRG